MNLVNSSAFHNISEGVLEGKNVKHYKKYLKDVINLYENNKNLSVDIENTLVYEVYSYTEGDPSIKGNLNWGLTLMYPVYIHNECNMTRGHFHQDRNCAEFYFGIEGDGLLLLMNENNEIKIEKICKGSLHHIDGKFAHRIVNTGDTLLKVGACWPTTAGHDYDSIEKKEFPFRVYKFNNKIKFIQR